MICLKTEQDYCLGGNSDANSINAKETRESESDRKIERIIAYMSEHVSQSLQVSKLAALANISVSHFFALFKQHTGFSPIEFFIRMRMLRACKLLDSTTLSVKEVAATMGYDDPFYFSRLFKSVNAVSPSDYRKLPEELRKSKQDGEIIRHFASRGLSEELLLLPDVQGVPAVKFSSNHIRAVPA